MQKILAISGLSAILIAGVNVSRAAAEQAPCDSLTKMALPSTKINLAQLVPAGTFVRPDPNPRRVAHTYKDVPAFCRVTATIAPTSDSDIKIEVWMPATGWNGKFRGQGNGGFAGAINYNGMAADLKLGYATGGTDTGHTTSDAVWALGHPEKIIDFGNRGLHEMTVVGKAAVKAFYGDAPLHAYFASCSNGGRQALMEAQRFPDDYDGILAGAPANYWTHLLASALYDAQSTTSNPASYIPTSKVPAIAKAVNASCDAKDGVTDGVLNDPRQCHFDPASLLCKSGDSDSCLTGPQVSALKKLYQGAHDSNGRVVFPGFLPGGEDGQGGWGVWITGPAPGKSLLFAFGYGYFADMVYGKADWDYKKTSLDDAVAASDEKFSAVLNSTASDMTAFKAHGGKLIIYHGWNDAAISALNSINYYDSVGGKMGLAERDSFLRLFMVPGMQHCG